jgi:hypothetical protein
MSISEFCVQKTLGEISQDGTEAKHGQAIENPTEIDTSQINSLDKR